jgi:hypothetical protein
VARRRERADRAADRLAVMPAATLASASTRTIERMVRISRVSIDSNVEAVTAQLDLPFRRIVARLA